MSGQKSMINRIEAVLGVIQWMSIFIASIALVILIVTFGWLVFGRYVLNVTPTWVEQLALVLICYIAFLGAAAGVKDETHLGVSLFRDMLPIHVQKATIVIIDFMLAAFGMVMFLAGRELMVFGWDSLLPMLNIPESFRTMAIAVCGLLIFLHAGSRGIIRIINYAEWSPNPIVKES